jgi:hypothetical protein
MLSTYCFQCSELDIILPHLAVISDTRYFGSISIDYKSNHSGV